MEQMSKVDDISLVALDQFEFLATLDEDELSQGYMEVNTEILQINSEKKRRASRIARNRETLAKGIEDHFLSGVSSAKKNVSSAKKNALKLLKLRSETDALEQQQGLDEKLAKCLLLLFAIVKECSSRGIAVDAV